MDLYGYLTLYALSDFIPVMTDTEICLLLNGRLEVKQCLIDKWKADLKAKRIQTDNIFEKAYAKQR